MDFFFVIAFACILIGIALGVSKFDQEKIEDNERKAEKEFIERNYSKILKELKDFETYVEKIHKGEKY